MVNNQPEACCVSYFLDFPFLPKQRSEFLANHFEEVSPKIYGSALPHLLARHGFDFSLHCREKLANHHLGGAITPLSTLAVAANLYVLSVL